MKIAYVKWDDAAHFEGPLQLEDIKPGYVVETVGILVAETKTHVIVAGDKCRDNDGMLRDVHTIPWGMVVEIRVSDSADWDEAETPRPTRKKVTQEVKKKMGRATKKKAR